MGQWICIGILGLIILMLLIKIHLLRKSAREISLAFSDRITDDTNTLIDISSNDKEMRRLADGMNKQLCLFHTQRHRFVLGDLELKNAVTNISHDLRTPLTAICGYLDLLEQEEMSEAARRYTGIIRSRTELLTDLTEELFGYSVIRTSTDRLREEPVVINRILEENAAAFYADLKQCGITPEISIPEEKIVRTLDPSALSRVFSNLFHNALKYSDGDLNITLSTAGEITFSNAASRLNEVQVGRMFQRFYTVGDAKYSTGLGLAIAKNLVEQMHGTIQASYCDGRLRICICFPGNELDAKIFCQKP